MPQGEIPQNFRSNQPFLLPRILAIKKRGETFLPESSFLISTAKDWSCEGVFSIKLRSVISKTQFFDWGACKLMKPCEKRNCCLAQNYFSYQAISECWYLWILAIHAMQNLGEKQRPWRVRQGVPWKKCGWVIPAIRTDEDALLWCIPDLKDGLAWGMSCLVGRLIPKLDDNKCGVPLDKKKCWNIEYTEHHVMFENEYIYIYIISIWDRPASHMVPYVISVVADCAPWIHFTPKHNTYLAY